jgi:hypothetical protein
MLHADVEGGMFSKQAGTDEERARLARERAVLSAVAHPGIVRLARVGDASSGEANELTLHLVPGGSMADLPRQSVAAVAGLGAALATTVADLHHLGIAHGALEPSHVLLDDEGRPVLCSLGRTTTASADEWSAACRRDVQALAGLLLDRLPAGASPRLVRRLRAAASPRRRPADARRMAHLLVNAVPDARLPEMTGGARTAEAEMPSAVPVAASTCGVNGEPASMERFEPAMAGRSEPDSAGRSEPDSAGRSEPDSAGRSEPDSGLPPTPGDATNPSASGGAANPLAPAGAAGRIRLLGGRRAFRPATVGVAGVVGAVAVIGLALTWSGGPPRAHTPPAGVACPPIDEGCRPVPTPDGVLSVGLRRYRLTQGQVVVLGRWYCSPAAYPAVLQPANGSVWMFREWATAGQAASGYPIGRVPGAVSLVVRPYRSGCDGLEATTSDGLMVPLKAAA